MELLRLRDFDEITTAVHAQVFFLLIPRLENLSHNWLMEEK